jgi:antitoxin component YwqK of YwqJK toxin-antitoxin module
MHRSAALLLSLALAPLAAHALLVCDLDGQPVDPANGHTTKGRSGTMHCRDGAGGPLQRDQELRDGVFMGVMRYYRKGVLQSEFNTNERGNRDGLAREFAATEGNNPVLREESFRNGTRIGLSRSWHANGPLGRLSFNDDDGRELAVAEFTARGQLSALRCGPRPLFAPHADDAAWCGFKGSPGQVTLFGHDGRERSRLVLLRGERVRSESLWDNGKPAETSERTETGGIDRNFAEDGVKRREVQWVRAGTAERPRRITTLDQEFHENGTLVRERRWTPTERGSELLLEQRWYLNGQPREKQEFVAVDGKPVRRDTRYHDNGRVAFEGSWLVADRYDSTPLAAHKQYDDQGRLRSERSYDARGKLSREREWDEAGQLLRDDELFEDGSRKAVAR